MGYFSVSSHIDLRGASGAAYRFRPAKEVRIPMAGGFVYVRAEGGRPEVIYASTAENLVAEAEARWPEAKADHGATDIFVRLNVSRSARHEEIDDIVQGLRPAMNAVTVEA